MAYIKIEDISFTYPLGTQPALKNLNVTFNQGDFIVICGKSGCGKSTLLRHLKPIITPHGTTEGTIYFNEKPISELNLREQTTKIGFVLQNPDNQIVTDKVWHELAFGLESLGERTDTIRLRVAEMASFFGITDWFEKSVFELSGGQKQLLNLASIMVMQPEVLVLDEPTSQLDPIAAAEFFSALRKINTEIGTTIIITEHRLEEVLPLADKVLVLADGEAIVYNSPKQVGKFLAKTNNDMFLSMPAPMRIYSHLNTDLECPITVKEGRQYLSDLLCDSDKQDIVHVAESNENSDDAISFKDVWFRYEKNSRDIVKDLNIKIKKGTTHAIVGANGAGKTTTLSLISKTNKAYRGTVKINGVSINKISDKELFENCIAVLPQNPQIMFVQKTVELDLLDMLSATKMTDEQKKSEVMRVAELVMVDKLLLRHPFDLSGGEQQRAALAKILLLKPQIILLDEPTKGLDSAFKEKLADIFSELKKSGITIVMVSHDIEFCAKHSDMCSMFFNGNAVSTMQSKTFFAHNSFYTTAANRMARSIFPNAVTDEEVIHLCRNSLENKKS